MTDMELKLKRAHPDDNDLSDYLGGLMPSGKRHDIEGHMASCDECLAKISAAYESTAGFNKKGRMKNINIYLILAIISFTLSFVLPRYFLQLLTATLLLGAKWIVDSKTTKMLITIYEAWKSGGGEEASRVLQDIDSRNKGRF